MTLNKDIIYKHLKKTDAKNVCRVQSARSGVRLCEQGGRVSGWLPAPPHMEAGGVGSISAAQQAAGRSATCLTHHPPLSLFLPLSFPVDKLG